MRTTRWSPAFVQCQVGRGWQELQRGQLMKGLKCHMKVLGFYPPDQREDSEQGETCSEADFRKNTLASGLENEVRQGPWKYLEILVVVCLSVCLSVCLYVWVRDSED